jgi:hypothetical protein
MAAYSKLSAHVSPCRLLAFSSVNEGRGLSDRGDTPGRDQRGIEMLTRRCLYGNDRLAVHGHRARTLRLISIPLSPFDLYEYCILVFDVGTFTYPLSTSIHLNDITFVLKLLVVSYLVLFSILVI